MPRSRSKELREPERSPVRYWRMTEASEVVTRLEASGLSVREFARQEGLNVQRLYRWRRALAGGEMPRAPRFLEVVPGASSSVVEVVLLSGAVLRVPRSGGPTGVRSGVRSGPKPAEFTDHALSASADAQGLAP